MLRCNKTLSISADTKGQSSSCARSDISGGFAWRGGNRGDLRSGETLTHTLCPQVLQWDIGVPLLPI